MRKPDPESIRSQTFVKVAGLDNLVEAQVVEALLNELKIPYLIRSYHDTAYDGLFQTQKGWGEIRSPLTSRETILEILRQIRKGDCFVEDKA